MEFGSRWKSWWSGAERTSMMTSLAGNSLKREFFRYVIPSILAQWVYALYTMMDGMFVARGVNEIALTAVNLANPFIQTMFALSLMFAVGASTIVAILMGENKLDKAHEVFTQNVVTQLLVAAGLSAGVITNLESVAKFLGARDPETLGYVKEYLLCIVPFSAAFLLSYTFEILMKTDGFPKRAVVIVTTGAVENCILDWLFVIVLHKGVPGAAIATSLSQCTVILLYLWHFLGKKGQLRFRRFHFQLRILGRQVRNGFSSGLTELSAGVVIFVFNQVILHYLNREALVSYTIVSYVNSIVVLSATGIAQGSQPLISYYYGQRNMDACKKLLRYCICSAGVFCTVSMVLCMAGAGPIVSAYIGADLPELRTYSVKVLRTFVLSFLAVGYNIILIGYFTSVERSISATVISAGRGFVFLLGSLMLLTRIFGGDGIWWAPLLSESLCLSVTAALFARYRRRDSAWNGGQNMEERDQT